MGFNVFSIVVVAVVILKLSMHFFDLNFEVAFELKTPRNETLM